MVRISLTSAQPLSPSLLLIPPLLDYISTPDSMIEDYLTAYSGLVPGDLDPLRSPHHVVTLRDSYLKLRRLLARGYDTKIGAELIGCAEVIWPQPSTVKRMLS